MLFLRQRGRRARLRLRKMTIEDRGRVIVVELIVER